MRRWRGVALVAVALAAGAFASIARADGDPASDYLVARQVFLSSQSTTASPSQRQLLATVEAANRAGFAIRVAIISSDYDLGSITALWRKPDVYARFLGLELSLAYKQRLLVVMPNGFGFNWPGHSTGSAYRLLAKVPIEPTGTGLTGSAQAAVLRLAAGAGITLPALVNARTNRTGAVANSGGPVVIIAAAMAALAVTLALLVAVRRRRRTRLAVMGGVSVTTKRIAGTTINYITHTEAAYIVDSTGHERALFLWPFYPQDVQRTLRQLS